MVRCVSEVGRWPAHGLSPVDLGFSFLLVMGQVLVSPVVWDGCMVEGWQGFCCCFSHPVIVPQGLGEVVPKWTQPG